MRVIQADIGIDAAALVSGGGDDVLAFRSGYVPASTDALVELLGALLRDAATRRESANVQALPAVA